MKFQRSHVTILRYLNVKGTVSLVLLIIGCFKSLGRWQFELGQNLELIIALGVVKLFFDKRIELVKFL